MNFDPDENGYFGEYGGAYIPEMLHPNVAELKECYREVIASPEFQEEFRSLLTHFVGRPTPLYHAKKLSKRYGTNIFLKREDLAHTGAHKINNTLGQVLLAKKLGKTRIIAETGAGQHGVATATVCALMDLPCVVYMGAVDIERQSLNVARMKMLGAQVTAVHSGSKTLKDATNEALRDWIAHPRDTHYIIGSVVGPHPFPDLVARLQAVVSEELLWQLPQLTGRDLPTTVVACVGGGSNAMGGFFHFLDKNSVALIGIEAAGEGVKSGRSAATLELGSVGVLHGCKTIFMQSEDGQVLEAHSISAGLDYPGVGPQHAHLRDTSRVRYISITDEEALQAGALVSRTEGLIPALETAHAFAFLEKERQARDDLVVIIFSGRGDKDMNTYMQRFACNQEGSR